MYPQTFLTYNYYLSCILKPFLLTIITYHVSLNLSYLQLLPIMYPQTFLTYNYYLSCILKPFLLIIITYYAYVISDNCGRPNCLLLRRITILNIIHCQYHFFPMICFILSIMSFVQSRQTLYRSISRKMKRV